MLRRTMKPTLTSQTKDTPDPSLTRKIQLEEWKQKKKMQSNANLNSTLVTPIKSPLKKRKNSEVSVDATKKIKGTLKTQSSSNNKENLKQNIESPNPSKPTNHVSTPTLTPLIPQNDEQIEKYKEEIKNLKTALSLLQSSETQQNHSNDEFVKIKKDLFDKRNYIKLLKKYVKKNYNEKCEAELMLSKSNQYIEQLQSHIAEMTLLYTVAKEGEQEDANTTMPHSIIRNQQNKIESLHLEIAKQKEEINALRFSNEMWLQRISELRGKYITLLQKMHKEHKTVEEDLKCDTMAWNELMNTTVKQLQDKMQQGLKDSITKIQFLEQQIEQERRINIELKNQLSKFSPVNKETTNNK